MGVTSILTSGPRSWGAQEEAELCQQLLWALQGLKERGSSSSGEAITSLPVSIPLSTVQPSKLPVSIPLASVVLPSRAEKVSVGQATDLPWRWEQRGGQCSPCWPCLAETGQSHYRDPIMELWVPEHSVTVHPV